MSSKIEVFKKSSLQKLKSLRNDLFQNWSLQNWGLKKLKSSKNEVFKKWSLQKLKSFEIQSIRKLKA